VPRCYKQGKLGARVSEQPVSELVRELLGFRCYELLVAEARDCLATQRKGECPPLEVATKQRLVKM
jgi:hypothetical protein